METAHISIPVNKDGKIPFLSELINAIPTNTILNKKLTGLGATYLEIKSQRNSIIVEPNVPVIKGKCKDPEHKKDNLLGVYKGVTVDDIIDYLEESAKQSKHIKILTTPESFNRVHTALDSMDIEIRFDCFLLFDEAHKFAKDADFRKQITLPMDLFFECEQKAMVSATPMDFSDPRFEEQGFQWLELSPSFDYTKDITVRFTNNTLQTVKERFQQVVGNIFIFCNSTDMIYNMMLQLHVMEESAVFCSNESVGKLRNDKDVKFTCAYDTWNNKKMKRFNWLTSRFYNAVDIKLEEKPHVLLLTNSYFAEWTLLDPATDVIQAVGRFRNGVSSIEHIASVNRNLGQQEKEEIKGYVRGLETAHNMLVRFHDTTPNLTMREAWNEIIDNSPFNKFLNAEKQKDYFLIDNYVDDQMVKGYYSYKERLLSAYDRTGYFKVLMLEDSFKFGDYERLKKDNPKLGLKERRRNIVEQLEMLGPCETEMEMEYKNELIESDSFIVEAYEVLGMEIIQKLDYREKKIREAMILKQYNEGIRGNEAIKLIKNSFKVGTRYSDKYIKSELVRIFQLVKVNYPKAVTSHTIGDFFEYEQKNTKKDKGKLLITSKI